MLVRGRETNGGASAKRWATATAGMEVKGEGRRAEHTVNAMKRCGSLNDALHIIEDMNLLYIRQIACKMKDCNIQDKMDFEIRMREGICKLLAACTQRDQVVQAAKNLLTCNARILGYMAELQKRKEEQILHNMARRSPDAGRKEHSACYGKIAISDIRIPLMWKDSDHFNNRGKTQRFAVFCLLKIGANVFDTELVIVDKSLTDICFENLIIL
ncbi:rhotekin-2 isoform X3 [Callorhinchus milii]|uniref:rhotekin-2 isoform X3 n=1 Tax=Callorhinchus milii TaxID=7868 RepID=UPI000457234D|nr:rhotekin-2 isoform X3 [Callorhinchus milii]|eukprot:gi/632936581/ref/XP_007895408.1/ PREDICTED: rhotekin-2 isoform X4 [Callorhinchus milii]